jgi:heme/copper-type cytochrome/quinol oxidase subunit 1
MRVYLSVVTGHAVVMVFLTYVPVYYGAFANYLIPIQLGARDFAYPRLNNFSFWVFPPALILFTGALFKYQGMVTGWTFYPPLTNKKYSPDFNIDVTIISIVLIAVGSLISTINLISTFRNMRGFSMKSDYRFIPLSVYGSVFGAILFTFVAPILGVAVIMLYLDRHGLANYFNVSKGGDVVLYQHIFWFFGHPEVYVLILPTFGYVSNIIVYISKQNVLSYDHMVISMFAICLLGSIVWGHHMYIGGLNRGMKNMFTATSLFVSIPSTLKIHSWIVTLQTGNFMFTISSLFVFTFLVGILLGGATGIVCGTSGFDFIYHDTYYVIGHFHLVLSMGGFSIVFAVIYHYWFFFFRVKYNKTYAVLHFLFFFWGELLTFIPACFLGMAGMPRRINDYPVIFAGWHGVSSLGHGFVLISFFFFFILFIDSKLKNETASILDLETFGVPKFKHRLGFYLYQINKLRFVKKNNLVHLTTGARRHDSLYTLVV